MNADTIYALVPSTNWGHDALSDPVCRGVFLAQIMSQHGRMR